MRLGAEGLMEIILHISITTLLEEKMKGGWVICSVSQSWHTVVLCGTGTSSPGFHTRRVSGRQEKHVWLLTPHDPMV